MVKPIYISIFLSLAMVEAQAIPSIPVTQNLFYNISSSISTKVVGPTLNSLSPAVEVAMSCGWTAHIPGSIWIWDNPNCASGTPTAIGYTCWFTELVPIDGKVIYATLQVAADDDVNTFINGILIESCSKIGGSWNLPNSCEVASLLNQGINLLQFSVTNTGDSSCAGVLFGLSINVQVI